MFPLLYIKFSMTLTYRALEYFHVLKRQLQRKMPPDGRHPQLLTLYGIPLLPSSPSVARRVYAAAYISNASSTSSSEAGRAKRRAHRYQLTFGPQARVSRNSNSSEDQPPMIRPDFPGSTSTVCCRSILLLLLRLDKSAQPHSGPI